MRSGVVLYGPPASGKDTVTDALAQAGRFALVPRLKSGSGRTAGYRMVTDHDIARLHDVPGEILWQVNRYAATYIVARSAIRGTAATAVPVVHVGQVDAVDAIRRGMPELAWIAVELWCPRNTAAARIAARATGDDSERLAAYDATPRLDGPDLRIDTSTTKPHQAARQIQHEVSP